MCTFHNNNSNNNNMFIYRAHFKHRHIKVLHWRNKENKKQTKRQHNKEVADRETCEQGNREAACVLMCVYSRSAWAWSAAPRRRTPGRSPPPHESLWLGRGRAAARRESQTLRIHLWEITSLPVHPDHHSGLLPADNTMMTACSHQGVLDLTFDLTTIFSFIWFRNIYLCCSQ